MYDGYDMRVVLMWKSAYRSRYTCQYCLDYCMTHLIVQVAVSTKNPNSDKQYVWEAEADCSSFVVREETDPDFLVPRGTSIILYLKVRSIHFLGCWCCS